MRLNFAGVADADIREGVRRIGRAVREQLGLLGSLTGTGPAAPTPRAADRQEPAEEGGAPLADVVALPRRGKAPAARRHQDQ
jgi:2-aminoadipate transaminase